MKKIEEIIEKIVGWDLQDEESAKELAQEIYANSLEGRLEGLERLGFYYLFSNPRGANDEICYRIRIFDRDTQFRDEHKFFCIGKSPMEAVEAALERIENES